MNFWVILAFCAAAALALLVLYRFRAKAWYWHLLSLALAVAIVKIPRPSIPIPTLPDENWVYVPVGIVAVFLFLWGIAAPFFRRRRGMRQP